MLTNQRRSTYLTRTVVSVALAAALIGCSPAVSTGAQVRAIGQGGVSAGIPTVKKNQGIILPLRSLCTTGSPVRIVSVRPTNATGGLRFVDWGTRYESARVSWPQFDAAVPGRVSDIPGFGHHPIKVPCQHAPPTAVEELVVSVAISSLRGTMTGVTLRDAAGQTTFAQYALALCTARKCDPPGT
jgi:hypothetical protein